jgi:hypothetical protein
MGFLLKSLFSGLARQDEGPRSCLARMSRATMPCLTGDEKVAKRRAWQSATSVAVQKSAPFLPAPHHADF